MDKLIEVKIGKKVFKLRASEFAFLLSLAEMRCSKECTESALSSDWDTCHRWKLRDKVAIELEHSAYNFAFGLAD